MNKKILISLSTIAVIAMIAIGGTVAYYSNTETSQNNAFIAGAIDLKVDNECHYNGMVCGETSVWVGPAGGYPVAGTACDCTWTAKDLKGQAIFSLLDIKPGDKGEDTISLHVDTNPAWICAEISNVAQTENGCNPPELKAETAKYDPNPATCGIPGVGEGELWSNLYFSLWMDKDCDNIFDEGVETYLVQNAPATDLKYPIADSQTGGTPIQDTCIGVEWNVPSAVGNEIQGDSVTGDITFNAYQGRHNDGFECFQTSITVVKTVINDNGGNAFPSDFGLKIDTTPVLSGVATKVTPGAHVVSEAGLSGYTAGTWGGDCDENGNVNISFGDNKTCTITNDDIQPKLTITKTVVNDNGGEKQIADFPLFVGTTPVNSGEQNGFNAGNYTVSETSQPGYSATFGGDCDVNGQITLNVGDVKSCTITNDDQGATLKIVKTVTNNNGGTKEIADFVLKIDGDTVANNSPIAVNPGLHTASEVGVAGYSASDWGTDCAANGDVTIALGDNKTCTITNDDQPGTLIVKKIISGGSAGYADFSFKINDGNAVQFEADGQNDVTVDAGTYTVTESTVAADYTSSYSNCTGIVVANGGTKTCEITNTYVPLTGTLTVIKHVDNSNGGTKSASDFSITVTGNSPDPATFNGSESGTVVTLNAGSYDVDEVLVTNYAKDRSADCTGTMPAGGSKTCTITNTFQCFAQGDVMLVIDRSGSISSGEMTQMKTAAHSFVTALNPDGGVHMGQTSFQTTGTLNLHLTASSTAINAAITALTTSSGNTNLQHGIKLANGELDNLDVHERPAVPDYMIVITDGEPNVCDDIGTSCTVAAAQTVATAQANLADAAGVEIFVVGVGVSSANQTFLTNNIATDAAHYFGIANYEALETALLNIAYCGNPPVTLLSDGFGTGSSDDSSFDESPVWTEGGAGAEKRANTGTGDDDDAASPNGGRFALIEGTDGYICRIVDATGYNTVRLSYYWAGDSSSGTSDDGIVEFRSSATSNCGNGTWTPLQNHGLENEALPWSTQAAFGNAGMEDTSFFLRFRTSSTSGSDDFRIDGVVITGIPN